MFRDWKLPACFAEFRTELEQHHGAMAGARRFVRVLQLLPDHPLARVRQAVEACRREQLISAEAVIQRTLTVAASESQARRSPPLTTELITLPQVQVPLPDLSRFNRLLGECGGGDASDGEGFAAAEAGCESQVSVFFT